MKINHSIHIVAMAVLVVVAVAGCSEKDTTGLEPATADTESRVFTDAYGPGVTYQAFEDSKYDAVQIDATQAAVGSASLKVTVPGPSAEPPWFAGGAFTNEWVRDLSGYNALTFWAKASKTATLNSVGLANDNTGNSKYMTEVNNLPLTTTWTKFILPIPRSEMLTLEKGLFWFAEGHENNQGYELWFDEIQFETVDVVSDARPSMPTKTVSAFVGATVKVDSTKTVFNVDGTDMIVGHMPGYFTLSSSDVTVATAKEGEIKVVGAGSADITASLGTVPVVGSVTVNSTAPPATAAPTPTTPASDVISIFSDEYDDVPVDTYLADWSEPRFVVQVQDFVIGGNTAKVYTNLGGSGWVGIEFASQTIDATAAGMKRLHLDVWAPGGTEVRVKLVDFGANGVYDGPGSDDSQHEISFNAGTTPPFTPGSWIAIDVPLSEFVQLLNTEHLAQLIISGDVNTVFVDNIYLYTHD